MNEELKEKGITEEQRVAVERIYVEWNRAWSEDDLEAMLALYAPDAAPPLHPALSTGTAETG